MSRITEIADSTGTPMYIRDATDEGLSLYLNNGFQEIDTLRYKYQDVVMDFTVLYRPGKTLHRER